MKESTLIILDERLMQHLLHQVRKAQGKLYQVKGGRELVEELNWAIRAIELTSYEQAPQMLDKLIDEQGLTYIE